MMIVFDNPVLYVADFPAEGGIEIIDKRSGSGGFLRDAAAQRFRAAFRTLLDQEPDVDAVADFIDAFDPMLNQPATYH
ncbi:MAG: DUF3567 family protein [Rhodocyclaceae bacterium]|jgi:hypothetical protein